MIRVRTARLAWIVGGSAALSLVGSVAGAQSRAQPTFQVKAGVTIAPDSVRVGDPFRVTIGVRAPAGAAIEFPRALDTTAAVQSLDPVQVRTSADTTVAEQYGDYRVAAWDIGKQPIRLEDVLVRYDGVVRRVSIVGESVFVKSVLPADSTKRVPKPPRPLIELSAIPWWLWALIAAAVIAIGLLLWWWLHRRKTPPAAVVIDPFGRAEKEFQRIEALGLLDAGERGRYVTLMIEVLRDYLAARYAEAMLSLTSSELQRTVRDLPHVPQDRLTRLLTEADLIKFARRPVSGERARELGREARAIVALEHQASMPAPAEQERAA
ncbi:MAG TPA: hypothetical protein VFS57_02970 [Gemmatimonadaceae bacterium]|nr:hypothetical protein [Gemmatimonadaceae bacterium]